nr:sulfur carrier protein ThiS [Methyloversatilis thermotolerans]
MQLNGRLHPIQPGQTLTDLIAALALTGKRIAVERNGEIVPRAHHAATVLTAGDRIEIVIAVGGG